VAAKYNKSHPQKRDKRKKKKGKGSHLRNWKKGGARERPGPRDESFLRAFLNRPPKKEKHIGVSFQLGSHCAVTVRQHKPQVEPTFRSMAYRWKGLATRKSSPPTKTCTDRDPKDGETVDLSEAPGQAKKGKNEQHAQVLTEKATKSGKSYEGKRTGDGGYLSIRVKESQ